jgi:hypothetical protein
MFLLKVKKQKNFLAIGALPQGTLPSASKGTFLPATQREEEQEREHWREF